MLVIFLEFLTDEKGQASKKKPRFCGVLKFCRTAYEILISFAGISLTTSLGMLILSTPFL
jgi:hypothetical protein